VFFFFFFEEQGSLIHSLQIIHWNTSTALAYANVKKSLYLVPVFVCEATFLDGTHGYPGTIYTPASASFFATYAIKSQTLFE